MLKKIKTSPLETAYEEQGGANGSPVILMHGFPDDAPLKAAVISCRLENPRMVFKAVERIVGRR